LQNNQGENRVDFGCKTANHRHSPLVSALEAQPTE
jgi:hypothetical protein